MVYPDSLPAIPTPAMEDIPDAPRKAESPEQEQWTSARLATVEGLELLNEQCRKVDLPLANLSSIGKVALEMEDDGVLDDLNGLLSYQATIMFVFRRLRREWEAVLASRSQ